MAKGKKQKTNHTKIPRSQKDVDDAEQRGYNQGTNDALVIFLFAIVDKHCPPEGEDYQFMEEIKQLSQDIHDICESIQEKYLSVEDMKKALMDEHEIEVEFM